MREFPSGRHTICRKAAWRVSTQPARATNTWTNSKTNRGLWTAAAAPRPFSAPVRLSPESDANVTRSHAHTLRASQEASYQCANTW